MEDTIKIELLTPLTGNFTSRELERQWEEGEYEYDVYEGLPLDGADLSQYESEIKEAIEKYNAIGNEEGKPCNLMDYFHGSAAIKESVIRAVPSVKQKDGVLYGCTILELTTFLWPDGRRRICCLVLRVLCIWLLHQGKIWQRLLIL